MTVSTIAGPRPTPRLTCTWVRTTGPDGRPRMEMRWVDTQARTASRRAA